MAPMPKQKTPPSTHSNLLLVPNDDDDDDFQHLPLPHHHPQFPPPTNYSNATVKKKTPRNINSISCTSQPLKPTNNSDTIIHGRLRPSKKPKSTGKENHESTSLRCSQVKLELTSSSSNLLLEEDVSDECFRLDSIDSTLDYTNRPRDSAEIIEEKQDQKGLKKGVVYSSTSNSLESRLLNSINPGSFSLDDDESEEFEPCCSQLDVLLKLCSEETEQDCGNFSGAQINHCQQVIECPLCGSDISHLTDELRQVHTNECLDKEETPNVVCPIDEVQPRCPGQIIDGSPTESPRQIADISPVLEWLRGLGLARYEEIFVQEEIDWDTLQWLTEEDLLSIGVTALGPRKKIVHALRELRKESTKTSEIRKDASTDVADEASRPAVNKLITDFFPGSTGQRKKDCTNSSRVLEVEKIHSGAKRNKNVRKKRVMNGKLREIPPWCCISGTPFRVDAFKYLRRDCSHWFLTHFHTDHYQGLTRSFSHGTIYCSLITARLVNLKIGIPWDKLKVLSLNQKINIAGIDVTCFDANHCPGSIIVLFETPNGKAILHTGDFRFSDEMVKIPDLQAGRVQTLILDTTYCNPQYDFPKQEAVIQFVIEAIQAEAFNPKTLFLIGCYTIGKERLFLEVARVLRKKVYVNAAKLRLLECLELPVEDMQWLTLNEQESHIHVVPMWTLASFKRLKCISNQYAHLFSLIVAFSPTGWTFGKGKKSSPGRRWQQGTIVRYEVPYSEHCSFTELKQFVKFISPENIVPSVNNDGPESSKAMVSLLLS